MLKTGEFAALGAALCWTICSIAFESASRKTGSLPVNFLRIFIAFIFMGIILSFKKISFIPIEATNNAWFFLSVSGIIGFVIGDQLLFKSFTIIGSKIAMIIMTFVPPCTVILGSIFLNEYLTTYKLLAIAITIIGILIVILNKKTDFKLDNKKKHIGFLFAFIGAVSQASGMILAKTGLENIEAYTGTQIRLIGGLIGFIPLILFTRSYKNIINAIKNIPAFKTILFGTVITLIGVMLSLVSIQNTYTGISATLMAVSPIMMIPATYIAFKQKTNFIEILGASIGLIGIAILFN